jgi:hypothetical protein
MTPAGQRLSRPRWGSGQVVTVLLAIAAIVAAGALGIRQIEITAPITIPGEPLSNDEIYTGSILFPSDDETMCHQLLFDNRTGQFKDNGTVDCQKAYTEAKPRCRASGPRCVQRSSVKVSGSTKNNAKPLGLMRRT